MRGSLSQGTTVCPALLTAPPSLGIRRRQVLGARVIWLGSLLPASCSPGPPHSLMGAMC